MTLKLSQETIDKIVRLRNEGLTQPQVMERLGVGAYAVQKYSPPVPRPGDWPEEDIATLKRMWAEGITADAIAAALPGKRSRCAILGKVSRLNLKRDPKFARINQILGKGQTPSERTLAGLPAEERQPRAGRATPKLAPVEGATVAAPTAPAPKAPAKVDDFAPANPQPFMDRRRAQCAWPIQVGGELLACCDPVSPRSGGREWCEHHTKKGQTSASTVQKKKAKETKYDRLALRRWS